LLAASLGHEAAWYEHLAASLALRGRLLGRLAACMG
jgi:hypothetical protein